MTPSHIHTFNPVTQQCTDSACGIINENEIAYIGESEAKATARFLTLEDAIEYVKEQQKKSISSDFTIRTCISSLYSGQLTVEKTDVSFDFDRTTVVFTSETGIFLKDSNVEISGRKINKGTNNAYLFKAEFPLILTKTDGNRKYLLTT